MAEETMPRQWAPVVMLNDGSHALVHQLPDGSTVPVGDPRGLVPYGTGFAVRERDGECPRCGSKITEKWSGVQCSSPDCTWWECL